MIDSIREIIHLVYDVPTLIAYGGMFILFVIIFAETGLMVGFFLPGDSLLVTAGLFAAKGDLSVFWLIVVLSIAAIAGDSTGYWIGKTAGPTIYKKEDSRFFKKSHLRKAEQFYIRHGGKTIILARFVPIIRTFAPVVAGAAGMEYKRFVSFNIFGGILWVASMSLIGYYLGRIPGIDKNIDIVVIIVIFLSFLPIIFEWWRNKRKNSQAIQAQSPENERGNEMGPDEVREDSDELPMYNEPRKEIDNKLSNLDRNDEPTFFQNLNKLERSDGKPPKHL